MMLPATHRRRHLAQLQSRSLRVAVPHRHSSLALAHSTAACVLLLEMRPHGAGCCYYCCGRALAAAPLWAGVNFRPARRLSEVTVYHLLRCEARSPAAASRSCCFASWCFSCGLGRQLRTGSADFLMLARSPRSSAAAGFCSSLGGQMSDVRKRSESRPCSCGRAAVLCSREAAPPTPRAAGKGSRCHWPRQ